MKRIFLLFFISLLSLQSSIAQKQNNIQTVNIEIRTLRTQQDSLLQHIEDLEYQISRQEDVQTLLAERLINTRDDYENILADSHSTRNLTLVLVTLIVGILGVIYPLIHNKNANKEQKALIKQMQDALTQIKAIQSRVNIIQGKIETSEKKAYDARRASYVNSLFSRALNERNKTRAIRLYSNILKIDDKYAEAYYNRAAAFYEVGNLIEASSDISQYIWFRNNDYKGYAASGVINSQLKNYKQAMSDFETAISLAPNEQDIYIKRADANIDFHRWRDAVLDYDKAEIMGALQDKHYNNRAFAYMKLGRLELALADVNDAITLNELFPDAYNTRGAIYLRLGKNHYELAMQDFSKAILLNPKLWEAYNSRATLYKLMEELETDPAKKTELTILRSKDLQIFRHKKIFDNSTELTKEEEKNNNI